MRIAKIWLIVVLVISVSLLPACSSPQDEIPLTTVEATTHGDGQTQISEPTQTAEQADIIFHNGNIITIEKDQPLAQAVAIRGNLIQAVGSDSEIMGYQGDEITIIDLQGKTLMPGFVEGHTHYTRNGWGDGVPLETMMQNMLAFGLTSIAEMHSTDDYINAMLEAERNGEIDVRMHIFGEYNCGFLDDKGKSIECVTWYRDNDPILDPTHMVRVPGVKIFVDGAGTPDRGCAYRSFQWPENITDYWPGIEETCGTPYGDLYLTEEKLTEVIREIQDRGYRAAFHVMGDAGIEITLNAIEAALDGEPNAIYRHQMQHNSQIRPELLERYEQLDILASVRGAFNTCEAGWYEDAFGEDYYAWNANRFALANMDVHAYSEGDFGRGDIFDITRANPLNPIRSLYGFVTHQQVRSDGSVCEPPEWIARHQISVKRALEMLTIEPAYAVSMEENIGSIKSGKFADLVILSDDPLTINPDQLGDLTVWMTMVNGEMKYCAPGRAEYCPWTVKKETTTTPMPTEPPQFVQVAFNCDEKEGAQIHIGKEKYVQTTIRWAAVTVEQVSDYLDAVSHSILVNGSQIDSEASHGEISPLEGRDIFFAPSFFNVGVLDPGEYEIRTVLTFAEKIYDGFEYYGPGTKYPTMEGTCTVIID